MTRNLLETIMPTPRAQTVAPAQAIKTVYGDIRLQVDVSLPADEAEVRDSKTGKLLCRITNIG